jgi:hypothetical protein
MPAAQRSSSRRWIAAWLVIIVVTVVLVLVAERTGHGRSIVSGVQAFLLKYTGVFALIGMTTVVGVGLLSTDRIVMRPGSRVVAQAVHRGMALAALTALAAHIVLEILAHNSHAIDAVVPFLAQHRPLYIGLGTIASDLFVLIVISGFLRGRFAGRWPWAWRCIHAIAYLAWPLCIVHGLLGGRAAKPYVNWSYGACLAGVALALTVRHVATLRSNDEKVPHPVSDRLSVPAEGLVPGARVAMAPLGPAQPQRRALSAAPPGPARTAQVSGITRPGQPRPSPTVSTDMTDPGSWRSPQEWQSPQEHPATREYPASQEWPASPDWPTSPGWKASPDEYQR